MTRELHNVRLWFLAYPFLHRDCLHTHLFQLAFATSGSFGLLVQLLLLLGLLLLLLFGRLLSSLLFFAAPPPFVGCIFLAASALLAPTSALRLGLAFGFLPFLLLDKTAFLLFKVRGELDARGSERICKDTYLLLELDAKTFLLFFPKSSHASLLK